MSWSPGRHLARAAVELAVAPDAAGVITRIDARAIGRLVAALEDVRRSRMRSTRL